MRLRWVITAVVLASLLASPTVQAGKPPGACAAAKRRAVGKKALDRMECAATAAIRGVVDPHCVERVEERFQRAFARAEQRGGCLTVGDADSLEAQVDGFVAGAVPALEETTTTTTSSTTTTTTTTTTIPPCPGGGRQLSDRTGAEHCWYWGQEGSSCDTTCAALGRVYDPATETFAGSGGDDIDCLVVASGGRPVFPFVFFLPLYHPGNCSADGLGGLGCFDVYRYCEAFCSGHLSISLGRCASPPTNSTDSASSYARVCACQ